MKDEKEIMRVEQACQKAKIPPAEWRRYRAAFRKNGLPFALALIEDVRAYRAGENPTIATLTAAFPRKRETP